MRTRSFRIPRNILAVEFTITNKVIVYGNTGPHSYSSYAVVQDIGVEPIYNRLEGGCVSATLILHIISTVRLELTTNAFRSFKESHLDLNANRQSCSHYTK